MDGTIHVAEVGSDGDAFRVGAVKKLFETVVTPDYQVSPDGTRLLLIKESDVHHLTPLTLVLNWTNDPDLRRH
jgi:hypothetical protein